MKKLSTLVSLDKWKEEIGVAAVTIWRWRKQGWLTVININGRLYLRAEDIQQFCERAARGEFARDANIPLRKPQEVS